MYCLGERIRFTLFGKSHGPYVGGILEGIPRGMEIDEKRISEEMELRKPSSGIGTPRKEDDKVEFVQGVRDGLADGNPILMLIRNSNIDNSKYAIFMETPRPGHADLPAISKFPQQDLLGGGQFSGRLTAAIVAAGGIAKQMTEEKGIRIGAFTRSVGHVKDLSSRDLASAIESRRYPTRACTGNLDSAMSGEILGASSEKDSVGGTVECITEGLPIGFGGIWFEALDSEIARAIFSIPACKGVEFGKGFGLSEMRGSDSNDQFYFDSGIKTRTNNMGGILGGMSDGAPMLFRAAFKPTPSIGRIQNTVNLRTMQDDTVEVQGRHDPCIVPRAVAVVEAMTALVIADQMRRGF
jgi:chorismate synthase